jgi:hypothetical protein
MIGYLVRLGRWRGVWSDRGRAVVY